MSVLTIRTVPIDQLRLAPYNPRKPLSAKARHKLETSLREFGLVEPLVWNECTGQVVGGHARLAILQSLGVTEVPVSVVHLSDAKEKALNVILNNQDAQGRYDPHKLGELLTELHGVGELEATGFDESALRLLTLEPADELPPLPEATGVEITLLTDVATFEKLAASLDVLVRQYDLVSHVRPRVHAVDA